ncbi:hypothetical protein OEZ86_012736 [Tetradesmus obliquus]|nr:hypothetical protein OEZ86_012736 [Tetradesmus obliquus]
MASPQAAALQLLQDFQQLQAHRAELYSRLGEGFRDFLGSGQEGLLAQLMAQHITPGFTAVSQQVIAIESCLKSSAVARPDLAGLLRQVQELERDKLRLTLSWQALRAAHASGRFSWQSAADRPRLSKATSKQQQQQQQTKQDVAGMLQQMQLRGGDDCGLGPPDPLDAGSMEPTEAEYNAAVREALQQLDECVVGINEVLQEVQEAVTELQEV